MEHPSPETKAKIKKAMMSMPKVYPDMERKKEKEKSKKEEKKEATVKDVLAMMAECKTHEEMRKRAGEMAKCVGGEDEDDK